MADYILKEMQSRHAALIKGREQLHANIHVTNGAIAELERLIRMIENDDLEEWTGKSTKEPYGGDREN